MIVLTVYLIGIFATALWAMTFEDDEVGFAYFLGMGWPILVIALLLDAVFLILKRFGVYE